MRKERGRGSVTFAEVEKYDSVIINLFKVTNVRWSLIMRNVYTCIDTRLY